MSETTPSPRPEQPAAGVRLRPPGSRPSHPEPAPDSPTGQQTPAAGETPHLPPPSQPTTSSEPSPSRDGAGSAGFSDVPPASSSTGTSSSPGTDGAKAPPPRFAEPKQLGEDLGNLIGSVAEAANERVAPGTDLLLTTPEEERGIGQPVANLLVRRLPAGMGGAGNPDLADALAAGITLLRYALRQVRMYGALRRAAWEAAQMPGEPAGEAAA